MADDQFEFYLTEVKAGWLESSIVLNGAHYDLSVHANFSEPIKDLCHCLADAHDLEGPVDMNSDYRHLEFEWVGEGWLYYWEVVPAPGGVLNVTVEFKGKREVGGQEYPVWKLDFVTTWDAFAAQVFTQASELLWLLGFTGYYDRWTKDFPAADLMRLGHLLHGQPVGTDDFSREIGYLAETR